MRIFGWDVRLPRLITHVIDSDSKTETMGFLVFFSSHYGAFVAYDIGEAGRRVHVLSSSEWMWGMVIASILVGGKMVTRSLLEAMQVKMGGGRPADTEKEVKDAAIVPVVA